MKKEENNQIREIYGKITLKERGWTDAMIKKFAPVPLRCVKNPMYKSASPVPIYDEEQVENIEKTKEFNEYKEKNKNRRSGAKKAVETKYRKTIDDIEKLIDELKPPKRISLGKIEKLAEKSFNNFYGYEREFHKCKRTLCNYIRHNMLENYDNDCWNSF